MNKQLFLSYPALEHTTHIYAQLKEEVLFYERKVKKTGPQVLLIASCITALFLIAGLFLPTVFTRWETLCNVLGGCLLYYLVQVQRAYHRLTNKKRALHNMLLENPRLAQIA